MGGWLVRGGDQNWPGLRGGYVFGEGAIIDNIKAGKKCFEVIFACNNIDTTLL